jgi:hypothetical protein
MGQVEEFDVATLPPEASQCLSFDWDRKNNFIRCPLLRWMIQRL